MRPVPLSLLVLVLAAGATAAVDRPDGAGAAAGHPAHLHHAVPVSATGVAATLPRTGWTVAADSAETALGDYAAARAVDGDPATFWHTRRGGTVDPLPHTFTIGLPAPTTVGGLRYLPRPAGTGGNGRIGQYEVSLSADGIDWGSPVATGTFADDATPKTVTFTATETSYLRLTALSEAGGRGQWTSAAEFDLLDGTEPPPGAGPGQWSAPIGFPLVPAAAAMLPTGKLLTWSAYAPYTFGGTGRTQTATLELATGAVSQRTVTNTGHDMFCPGTALLADGRVLVNGGSDSGRTSIYNPTTDAWSTGAQMNIRRGYNASTTLSTGRVFTLGGSWSGGEGGKNGEVWTSGTGWRRLSGAPVGPMLTADPRGVYRADNHGWLFAAGNGRVFQAGPSRQMNWYGTTGSGSTTPAGTRADDQDAMNGNAVMYDVGKILTIGGAPAYQDADASDRAYVVDINGAVTARRVASMRHPRAFHNSVVLPDGKVLVVGGQAYPVPFSDDTAVLTPELWDPATETFTSMAAMAVPRTYHSVALLLPDGRVFAGGGGLCGSCGTNHPDGEIFTPPYLLNPDGTAATRPTITSAPGTAAAGSNIAVGTGSPVTSFALVRLASVTHSVNNDQRRIPLTPTSGSGGTYTLPIPADRGVALPGYYMLFALDAAGVPSVARIIRIT